MVQLEVALPFHKGLALPAAAQEGEEKQRAACCHEGEGISEQPAATMAMTNSKSEGNVLGNKPSGKVCKLQYFLPRLSSNGLSAV